MTKSKKEKSKMTDYELKKLSRKDLLDLLIKQTQRTEVLEAQLAEAKRQIENRRIANQNAGSIAEAALQVNGVFEAAQAAAQQYLDNIQACSARCDKMLADTKRRCEAMEKKAEERVAAFRADVEKLQADWKNLD